jgi:predicted PurR-regulated permease PerM
MAEEPKAGRPQLLDREAEERLSAEAGRVHAETERQFHRWQRWQAAAQIVIAVGAILAICYYFKVVLLTVLTSALLAFMLAPLVDLFQAWRMPRALGAFFAVTALIVVLYGVTYFSYNRVIDFTQELPKYTREIRETLGRFRQHAETLQQTTEQVTEEAPERGTVRVREQTNWSEIITRSAATVTELVFVLSFVPFLIFFMLTWQEHVRSATVMLFKMENRNVAYSTLGMITSMIRSFIVGNLLVGTFMALVSTAVFYGINLPYFYFMGPISGFLSLIPYLGVILAMLPPLVAGLGNQDGTGMLIIVTTVLLLHLFALNVLYPKFLGSRLQLNPLAVTVALLFWGWIWGGLGLILAVPITAAAKIVFDHVESLRPYGAWLGE